MFLVISPHSIESAVCDEEVAFARAMGKRLVPIIAASVDFSRARPRIAALNAKIAFTSKVVFAPSLDALCAVLDLDVEWHRAGARLAALASACE